MEMSNPETRIARLEQANKNLVKVNRELRTELNQLKKAIRFKSLTAKAAKYDSLLKKFQALLVTRV